MEFGYREIEGFFPRLAETMQMPEKEVRDNVGVFSGYFWNMELLLPSKYSEESFVEFWSIILKINTTSVKLFGKSLFSLCGLKRIRVLDSRHCGQHIAAAITKLGVGSENTPILMA
jgi:hypothetical protein